MQFEINFIVSATVIYEIGRQKVIYPMRSDWLYVLNIIYKWDECTFIELGLLVRARFRPGPCTKSAGSVKFWSVLTSWWQKIKRKLCKTYFLRHWKFYVFWKHTVRAGLTHVYTNFTYYRVHTVGYCANVWPYVKLV